MNKINDLWYGYLEAGDKSSLVVIDPLLETGNPKTVYMYNLSANKITEYKREIAEPKLRALNSTEAGLTQDLKTGYDVARKAFVPRDNRIALAPAAVGAAVSVKPPRHTKLPADDIDALDDFSIDDSDLDLDEEMGEELEEDLDMNEDE
ncbi:MAG: hypothetical protein LJE85_12850 [Gammaproteobacteria bacterium]|jgi:hypothetical protein|nr:hypothetical protein [Gammaproteobacteria bacterium]